MENSQFIFPSKKTDRRISRTKKAITSAFLQILKEKNIEKVTIKELCERADINRKTFYTHYGSVAAVLSAIEDDFINQFKEGISITKNRKKPLTIPDIFRCIDALVITHSKFINQLMQINVLDSLKRKVKSVIKETVFEAMQQEGKYDTTILNTSLEYIVSGAVSIYIEWFYENSLMPFASLSKMTMEFVSANVDISLKYALLP